MIWGMGGWSKSPINTMAENRANAKSAKLSPNQNHQDEIGQQPVIIEGNDISGRQKVMDYLEKVGVKSQAAIANDLKKIGFKEISPKGAPIRVFQRPGSDVKVRLDPPQGATNYNHMHIEMGKKLNKTSYDKNLKSVPYESKAAHMRTR